MISAIKKRIAQEVASRESDLKAFSGVTLGTLVIAAIAGVALAVLVMIAMGVASKAVGLAALGIPTATGAAVAAFFSTTPAGRGAIWTYCKGRAPTGLVIRLAAVTLFCVAFGAILNVAIRAKTGGLP